MSDLTTTNLRSSASRVAVVTVVVISLFLGWYSFRWQVGNMLASLTPTTAPNAAEIAAAAAGLAPSDPMAARLAAESAADSNETISFYERAVKLAPGDYRWRVELARAFAQNGQPERAQAEFAQAVYLAPEYSSPRWHLGNFYFRQGRPDEALIELRKAAANHQTYRDQVFSLLWDYSGKDAGRLAEIVDNPATRAHLAYFLAARGIADSALRNWDQLSVADKARFSYRAVSIADGLYIKRHFPEALSFAKQLGNALDTEPERITNQSFETTIGEADQSRFGWQNFRTEPKVEITPDSKIQRSGSRSLRVTFRGFAKPQLANVYQTVVVEPGAGYFLSFWLRTDDLKSLGPPMLEVLNGVDDKTLVRSKPFSGGTSDWQQITLEFRTPENCTGIFIRTIRDFCGEDCPITGSFWYDDFELKRL